MAITKTNPALWEALSTLPLDRLPGEPGPETGFVMRLKHEEGWDYAKTVRVVAEYRRFLYLSTLGEVSPPADVDAAWHLHLTYTRAYWTGLCQHTLGRPLDHHPAAGRADSLHYRTVYEDTRRRYAEEFGEKPPGDIWPDSTPDLHKPAWYAGVVTRTFGTLAIGATVLWLAPMIARWIGIAGLFMLAFVALVIVSSSHGRTRRGSNGGGGDISFGLDAGEGGDGGSCGGGCGGD
jgi:hypothetical protein